MNGNITVEKDTQTEFIQRFRSWQKRRDQMENHSRAEAKNGKSGRSGKSRPEPVEDYRLAIFKSFNDPAEAQKIWSGFQSPKLFDKVREKAGSTWEYRHGGRTCRLRFHDHWLLQQIPIIASRSRVATDLALCGPGSTGADSASRCGLVNLCCICNHELVMEPLLEEIGGRSVSFNGADTWLLARVEFVRTSESENYPRTPVEVVVRFPSSRSKGNARTAKSLVVLGGPWDLPKGFDDTTPNVHLGTLESARQSGLIALNAFSSLFQDGHIEGYRFRMDPQFKLPPTEGQPLLSEREYRVATRGWVLLRMPKGKPQAVVSKLQERLDRALTMANRAGLCDLADVSPRIAFGRITNGGDLIRCLETIERPVDVNEIVNSLIDDRFKECLAGIPRDLWSDTIADTVRRIIDGAIPALMGSGCGKLAVSLCMAEGNLVLRHRQYRKRS